MSDGHPKIGGEHLERECVIYVRQSTLAQTRNNLESLERQYELVDRAQQLGWPAERVRVVDVDLGITGAQVGAREGFRQLVADVALGEVGLVLGIEISRLARDNAAWYQLLDLCALSFTLIADTDGVYDPNDYSDRLVLGLKGTISEAELHLIKGRLIAGLRHKAAKGELRIALPAGYVYDESHRVVKSPDGAVREAIMELFRRFERYGTVQQAALSMRDDSLELPRMRHRHLAWGPVNYSLAHDLLLNPCYAGAFAYGRSQVQKVTDGQGAPRKAIRRVPREQWRTLIIDHHEGYWTWQDFERIEAQITENSTARSSRGGAPREGAALLQGLVVCGRCGRNMHSAYSANRGASRRYYCAVRIGQVDHQPECQGMGGRQIDETVLDQVCNILEPASLAATAQALTHADEQEAARLAAFETAAERTRYAAERAWRQFDACEPENRLVARNLEVVWEAALAEAEVAQAELDRQRQRRPTPLSDEELAWLSSAGVDIRAVLDADTTTQQERKRLLRALIAKVVITIADDTPEVINVTIHWQGGATTDTTLPRRRRGHSYRATDEDTVQLVRRLARYYDDKTIARLLNRQHRTTATGLRFTQHRVCNLRHSYDIAVFDPDVTPADDDAPMVSITEAAAELDISRDTVYRWIRDGFIAGVQPTTEAPWRIRLDDQLRAKVAEDAPEGWVGLDQAATILGVARQTVLHRVQRGELNAVHVRRGKRKGLRIQVDDDQPGLFATPT